MRQDNLRGVIVRVVIAAVVLATGVAVTEVAVRRENEQAVRMQRGAASILADSTADRLSSTLQSIASASQSLEAFVLAHDGDVDRAEVPAFLDVLLGDSGGESRVAFRSISLAPDNRIAVIAPVAGNEAALGLSFPDHPDQWAQIEPIIQSGQTALVGPFPLVQGGSGLALRLPVRLSNGDYWGLVSTVVDSDALLASVLGDGADPGIAVGLRLEPGAQSEGAQFGDVRGFSPDADVHSLEALGRTWQVAAMSVAPVASNSLTRAVGYGLSLVVALLVYLLIAALQRRREVSRRLTSLSARVPGVLYQLRFAPDGSMSVPYVSEGFTELFPNAPARVNADAAPLWDCFAPEDAERGQASLRSAVRENRPWHERLRSIGQSGADRWVLTDAVPQRESDGSTIVHGLFTDVTDEVAAEEALRVSASVYASTRDGVVIMEPDGTIIDANPSFEALVGFSSEALAGRELRGLSAGITPAVVFEDMRTGVDRHGFWRGEIVTRSRLGAVATQMLTVSAVYDDAGEISHLVGVLTSLDNIHDDLVTGLPTRQVLEDRLAQAIESARRSGQRVALLLLGVDRFRDINEALGHRLGDLVLKEIGERLVSAAGDGVTVARVGGDEFAILVPTEASVGAIEDLVERCRGVLAAPFSPAERSVHAYASIGIAVYPDDAATDAALMLAADQALRVAKGEGPASYRFFTSAMQAEARARAALSGDLRAAIADGTLDVLFQPVVNLASGELVKAEALVRWDHPTRGPISPATFVPLAESLGLVADIGDHVFGDVLDLLQQARALRPAFAVSLNMSPLELKAAPAVHQRRVSELRRRSIPGALVIVEITEGVMVELNPAAAATMATYRDAGVEFAIDDFGTGYSSMAYLQQLDVDFIKIDQAFVGGLAPDSGDLALCQAMVVMAHSLNLAVIAEGIETADQADLLTSMGCDYGQGYLLDRPLTSEQLLERLRDGRRYR